MARSGHFHPPSQNDPFRRSEVCTRAATVAVKESDMSRYFSVAMAGGLAAVLLVGGSAVAQKAHVLATVNDAKWGPAPPPGPPGAQIAVLSGDPMKAVPYTVRFNFPANYVIPAHSHPADENVAITSGEFFMGMGDKVDKTHATSLPTGGYAMMPAGMNHF